ncbi:hypothetical protein D3C81_966170 [compost metagenome]
MVFEIKQMTLLKEVGAAGNFNLSAIFKTRNIEPGHDNPPLLDIEECKQQNALYNIELDGEQLYYTLKDDWMETPRKLTLTISFKYPVRWWIGQ